MQGSGVARGGGTGAIPPKLLVNVVCVQLIDVVTFFECVSRPAKSPGTSVSLQKRRVISRSPGNVKNPPQLRQFD